LDQLKKPPEIVKSALDLPGFDRLEFHRHGLALAPDPKDRKPGTVFMLLGGRNQEEIRACSCRNSRRQTCPHILELTELYKNYLAIYKGRGPDEVFRGSRWYKLASIIGRDSRDGWEAARLETVRRNGRPIIKVRTGAGREAARYYSSGGDAAILADRFTRLPEDSAPNRYMLLDRLFDLTRTDQEKTMLSKGFPTFRLLLEQSVWYRLAYHGFHSLGRERLVLSPGIDEESGDFTLAAGRSDTETLIRFIVPREKVHAVLNEFKHELTSAEGLSLHPVPLKSIFKISQNTELDLEIRPMIQLLQADGEERFFQAENFEKFRYGNLVYVKELGLMAELEKDSGRERRFQTPVKMVLKKSQVPSFLEEFGSEISGPEFIMDSRVQGIRILKDFDRFQINPTAIDRNWYWLDIRYGFGNASLTLSEVLQAREEGQRYLATEAGWVDCQAEAFESLSSISAAEVDSSARVRLSRLDLFKLRALSGRQFEITGSGQRSDLLRKLWDLKPTNPTSQPDGLRSELRAYQTLGFNWLQFLAENRLGGLLCDEMGLGKTHQAMALMVGLKERNEANGPALIVCPTTVLSHWQDKVDRFAPALQAGTHYGPQRKLEQTLKQYDTIITSYGVLLQDIESLSRTEWSLAVFDEIQNIKNAQTQTYQAAIRLTADVKLGLTGTPVENRLEELKALFDLVLPGYLGTDREFGRRYVAPVIGDPDYFRHRELSRLISPFVLRRLKETVLSELPDKIEHLRTCALSDDQVKLYRDAVEARGRSLIDLISRKDGPVPYIHIFALLNLLKRICDHPALALKDWSSYEQYESGKWDLFQGILQECLDNGDKVVVYSQYIDMIKIIEALLQKLKLNYVTLTGQSRNRGEIVRRFDQDPECRVFLGSLKAGGVGIDLIAASAVIHYDRWWNAAREDQATDRVHRIGQRKGVQVFKMITQGTLEEKIAAIIEKKKKLMESVIREDDPGVLKSFLKEELIELLSFSG